MIDDTAPICPGGASPAHLDHADDAAAAVGEVPASTGGEVDLDRIVGTIPVVLVFLEDPEAEPGRELLRGLGERLADFGRDRVQVLGVAPRSQRELSDLTARTEGNARVLADPDRSLAWRLDVDYTPGRAVTVLLDSSGEVAAVWGDQPDGTFADSLLARLTGLAR
jgi:peroxiredoxin